jgi:uncharacterized protein YjbI with pentapeptide repeats
VPEYDVFLSHNGADKPLVEELARRLVKAGIEPWLDTWNLIPGEPWQEAIEKALDSCATCAVFVGPSGTGPWQNEEMRAAIGRRVSDPERGFRVIPVLLPDAKRGERSKLPYFLVRATWVEFRRSLDDEPAFHRLVSGIRGEEPGPGPGQAIYEGECPYRGLQFFDVEHAPFFFGREALTQWLLDELRPSTGSGQADNRFLALIGPSGSGKSSLARAGLVAALKQGSIEGSADWPVAICRPGSDPLESLAVSLGQNTSDALALMGELGEDERALHITVRMSLRDCSPERRLVVLVDQFEEVFTLCRNEDLRQALMDNLLYAATVTGGQTVVILAMRADFYGKCAEYPTLAAALSDHQALVGPMTARELRQAIERPAQLAGGELEPGLAELILRDLEGQAGSLPLLQHALLELWEGRSGRCLTHAAYQTIGGVAGALEGRAEAVYQSFSEAEREICRQVFLRLTEPGEDTEDTKRRMPFRDLVLTETARETVEEVVQRLAGADVRLVTTEGSADERFVEVVHEALIRNWGRLRNWIDADRVFLNWRKRLRFALDQWQDKVQNEWALLRGTPLTEAERWLDKRGSDLGQAERDFIQASVALRELEERRERDTMRKELALEIYTQGAAGRNLSRADLRGADLQGANLGRANLEKADLRGAKLEQADLSEADLRGADLQGAELEQANLREANLEWADLSEANLEGANLEGAGLNGTDIRKANLGGANLRKAVVGRDTKLDDKWRLVWRIVSKGAASHDLPGASLSEANLEGVDLRRANLSEADLRGADLQGAKLEQANLPRADLERADLRGTDLRKANLCKANLCKANLTGANLGGTLLRASNLAGAILERADLRGADLAGADLARTTLDKADLNWAVLNGANLEGSDLREALIGKGTHLSGANYSISTYWPVGFDPKKAGAVLIWGNRE